MAQNKSQPLTLNKELNRCAESRCGYFEKEKFPDPYRDLNPEPSSR